MARPLRQNTAVDVPIGPFQSPTDGSPMNALTITQADVRLKKNGAAWAQKNSATAATFEENGSYECPLNATDTDTLGLMRMVVLESGALIAWEDFEVMPQTTYDALYGTGFLQVDVTRWLTGTPNGLATGRVDASVGAYPGNTAQTGDAFVRLGAPVGASISADLAVIEGQVDDIGIAGAGLTAIPTIATVTAVTTVNGLAANVITATSIASGALTAAKFAAGAFNAVWDVLDTAIVVANSIGVRLKTFVDVAISSRSTYAGADTAGTTTLLGRIIGTLAAGTHQPQSGDSFTRLGAPVGASQSADIASVKSDTTAINTAVDTEVAAIKAKTDQLVFTTTNRVDSTVVDKTDFALSTAGNASVRDAVTGDIIETANGGVSLQAALSVILAVVAGRTDTNGLVFRSPDGVAIRVQATVDANNNRTAIVMTPSA